MNLTERKNELERELASINRQIEVCDHEYGEAQYDPYIEKVPCGFKTVQHGSDVWSEPTGYREKEKERWSQTCKKCGHKRYTTKIIPTAYKPEF